MHFKERALKTEADADKWQSKYEKLLDSTEQSGSNTVSFRARRQDDDDKTAIINNFLMFLLNYEDACKFFFYFTRWQYISIVEILFCRIYFFP